jgi:hypothetical protein
MLALLAVGAALAAPAYAELSPEELAKLAQNPIGNLVSIPFQNNTNFGVGPQGGTQNILNIQPVYPFEVSKDWNVITRTIVPLIWQHGMTAGADSGHVPEVNRAMLTVPDPLYCLARDEERPTNEFGFLFAGVRKQP